MESNFPTELLGLQALGLGSGMGSYPKLSPKRQVATATVPTLPTKPTVFGNRLVDALAWELNGKWPTGQKSCFLTTRIVWYIIMLFIESIVNQGVYHNSWMATGSMFWSWQPTEAMRPCCLCEFSRWPPAVYLDLSFVPVWWWWTCSDRNFWLVFHYFWWHLMNFDDFWFFKWFFVDSLAIISPSWSRSPEHDPTWPNEFNEVFEAQILAAVERNARIRCPELRTPVWFLVLLWFLSFSSKPSMIVWDDLAYLSQGILIKSKSKSCSSEIEATWPRHKRRVFQAPLPLAPLRAARCPWEIWNHLRPTACVDLRWS